MKEPAAQANGKINTPAVAWMNEFNGGKGYNLSVTKDLVTSVAEIAGIALAVEQIKGLDTYEAFCSNARAHGTLVGFPIEIKGKKAIVIKKHTPRA